MIFNGFNDILSFLHVQFCMIFNDVMPPLKVMGTPPMWTCGAVVVFGFAACLCSMIVFGECVVHGINYPIKFWLVYIIIPPLLIAKPISNDLKVAPQQDLRPSQQLQMGQIRNRMCPQYAVNSNHDLCENVHNSTMNKSVS